MLKYLLEKEFKHILRDSFLPRILIMMPLVMMLVLPWAANQEVKDLRLSVVDKDKSSYSERLVNKINSSEYFNITDVSNSNEEALASIEADEADIILEIEPDFEKNLVTKGTGAIMISANSINGMKGGLGSSYLNIIVRDFTNEMQQENRPAKQVGLINIVPQYRFNPHLDYKVFMVPAIMVILLTMLCGFLPAINIVGEKEMGTIEQINVTPVSKFTFILSKLIPFWVIGLIVLSLCFAIAALAYNLIPVGGYLRIYTAACLYILVVSGLGLIISNFSQTMQQAMFVMFFVIMVFILMSGLFTPIGSMPQWAQNITLFNPLRYFISIMRMIYLKGSTLLDLVPQLGALLGFAVVFNLLAVVTYKKSS